MNTLQGKITLQRTAPEGTFRVEPSRTTAVATGTLFIVATVAALAAAAVEPARTGTDYLTAVAAHPNPLAAAALLYLTAAGTSAGTATALYPPLKQVNAAVPRGSVASRSSEPVSCTGTPANR